jgi:hypothetical protein
MDTVTYPDEPTQAFLADNVVPFKPRIDQNEDLARRYGMTWTPGLVWLTPDGLACHKNVGFFEPDEFLAESLFGCGQVAAGQSDWKTARERFDETARRWPKSFAAPAALYWAGVAAKKTTGEVGDLLTHWKKLLADHPRDAWAMKVSFIRDKK